MKKIFQSLVLSLLIISCNSDDTQQSSSVDPNPEQPEETSCISLKGSIILKTQAEVNIFAANKYCELQGANLTIGQNNANSDITDISALSTLKKVGGEIHVLNNPLLKSLNGLQNITKVGGRILIMNNAALGNLKGIPSIDSNDNNIIKYQILSNKSLQTLSGLENLTYCQTMMIGDSQALIDLNGLNNCNSIDELQILSNPILNNLTGLKNLKTSKSSIEISGNQSITTLSGLENLEFSQKLVIDNNNALTSLEGLKTLKSCSEIEITDNLSLTSINALNSLIDCKKITIAKGLLTNIKGLENNTSLSEFSISDIATLQNLKGFPNVKNFTKISVFKCSSLANVNELNTLTTLEGGSISISYNISLTSIEGLSNISPYTGSLNISNNTSLSDICPVKKLILSNYLTIFSTFEGNNIPITNYNVKQYIEENCL